MTEKQKTKWEKEKMYPAESEYFDILYGYKDKNLIIDAGKSGRICVDLITVNTFINELIEMIDYYKGVMKHA